MLRPIRSLFIGVTVGLPFLSIMLMILLPRHLYYGNGAGFLLGLGTHLSIMRTLEDEETLLASLDALQGKKGGREYAADEHGRRI